MVSQLPTTTFFAVPQFQLLLLLLLLLLQNILNNTTDLQGHQTEAEALHHHIYHTKSLQFIYIYIYIYLL